MNRIFVCLTLLAVFAWGAQTSRADVLYDLTSNYSSAANPDGVWTFGWQVESAAGGPLLNTFDSNQNSAGAHADFNYWDSSLLSAIPFVGKYQSATDSGEQDGTVFNANQVALHAGNSNTDIAAAVVRFSAPVTSLYRIDQAVFEYRSNIPGNQVYLFVNGTNLFQATLGARGSQAAVAPMFLNLNAGDYVDFVVGSRSGQTNSTTTQLNAQIRQITAIPEPATATSLSLICAALGLTRFRKKPLTSLARE